MNIRTSRSVPGIWANALIGVTALVMVAPVAAARTLRYVVLANGQSTGSEVDSVDENGSLDSDFEFNDRGRGPKIHAHYEYSSDGLPLRLSIKGVNYLKATVNERLVSGATGLEWSGAGERGSSTAPGFYLSNEGVGGPELAALVRALQLRKDQALLLLPTGRAVLDTAGDVDVESHGQKLHVRQFLISGLDLTPTPVWVDDDGAFFAFPGRWSATIREGWESVNETLHALQLKAEDERYARLARSLARKPVHPVAIEHVRLFDSEHAVAVADQTVVIEAGRIVAVGGSGMVRVPKGAERVEGRGRTLLPGLFDMHVHATPVDGILHVASGITSVRDLGNDIDGLQHLQDRWDRGVAIGPRVWKAGLTDGGGQYKAPTGIYVETVEQAEAAVVRYASAGYVQIKLYSSLKPELVPAIVAAAHRHGMRVGGHVPEGLLAADFVRLGADELQHMNFVLLNFLKGRVGDTRTPERFTAVGESAGSIVLSSTPVRDFVAQLATRPTPVDVTLGAFEGMFTARPGVVSPDFAPIIERLPAQLRRQSYLGGLPVTPDNDQRYREAFATMLRMTRQLFDAGVPVLVGTDGIAGLMLHRELELQVQAGIPAASVLQDATLLAARILKQEAEVGSVAVGKRADLLLVEGNPLEHISDIRRGRLVFKSGVVYDPARLYAAVGISPAP